MPDRSGGDERAIEAVCRAWWSTWPEAPNPEGERQRAREAIAALARVRGVRDDNESEDISTTLDSVTHNDIAERERRRSPQDEDLANRPGVPGPIDVADAQRIREARSPQGEDHEGAWIARAIAWMRSEQREILARGDGRELASNVDAVRYGIIDDLLKDAPAQ